MTEDLTGRKFGFLTVVARNGKTAGGMKLWRCRCDCGKECSPREADLKRRPNISCGCQHRRLASEANRTHGRSRTPEYNTWATIIARCHRKHHPRYGDYGGRGISVCERWRQSFENFLADMGPRPNGYSIERRDNNDGYNPKNCRWIPKPDQSKNTRETRRLTFNGETLHLEEWARRLGTSHGTIQARIRNGWTIEETLTIPVSRTNQIRNLRRQTAITIHSR